MKNTTIVIFLIVFCTTSFGQDYFKSMNDIVDQLDEASSYEISSVVKVYQNNSKQKLIQEFSAKVVSNELGYRSKIHDTEIISNENMVIIIDEDDHTVQIEPKKKLSKKDKELIAEIKALADLDSTTADISLLSSSEGELVYELKFSGEIEKMTITIDAIHKSIKTISYQYDEEKFPTRNYVEITYELFSLNHQIDQKLITADDVILKSGKKINLTNEYSDYQLYNLMFE